METLWQDLRYGLRRLLRSPGFTAVAVLTLALGIGANTAVFSILDALLVRLLPFPRAERLVMLESTHPRRGTTSVGREDFEDWQAQSTAFEEMAYTSFTQFNLTGQSLGGLGEPERITGTEVSAGFFPLLGVRPLLGRWLLPEEQTQGKNQVIIVSYGLWQRRFGGRPDLVGHSLTLNGRGYAVVGVMPASFRLNQGYLCEFWVPMQHMSSGRLSHQYEAFGRLKPGVSVAAAQAQLSAIAKRLEQAYPDTNTGWSVRVTSLHDVIMEKFGPAIFVFFAAVGVVLVIACANVANLLLARSTARTREIAVRRALGAGRFSLIRLLLAESLLVAVAAAGLGLLFAVWGIELAAAAAPAWLDLKSILFIDRNVLAFTLLLSVLTGVLTGLAPALKTSRTDINANLKEGGGGAGTGLRGSRVLSVLVISEVALATVLLVAGGLLIKSFGRLLRVNLGFRTDNVLVVRLQLLRTKYPEDYQRVEFYRKLIDRVRSLPGVISAGAIDSIPMGGAYASGAVEIEGRPMPRDWEQMNSTCYSATPDYFRTLGIPLLRGRFFTDQDRQGSEPVVIIDEALARQFFPNEDPLGKKIRPAYDKDWRTIVGIVGDVRHQGPDSRERPATYDPHAQSASSHMFLAVRTAVAPSSIAGAVRTVVRALDPDLPIMQVGTMQEALSESVAAPRHIRTLVGFFAGVAVLLAAFGLAGVMWYNVAQRTHEIGVRMALGAQQGDVLRLVLGRGLRLTLVGLGLGLGLALAATRLLSSLLYGVSPRDPAIFALVPVLLAAVALAANYLPVRRATRVDPVAALRHE